MTKHVNSFKTNFKKKLYMLLNIFNFVGNVKEHVLTYVSQSRIGVC